MKVAHIVCVFPPYKGGMGNSVFNFAETLSKREYDITVFTPDYGAGGTPAKYGFKVERTRPLFKFGNAAFLPRLFRKLENFDIIHLHYPFYGAETAILLRKLFYPRKTRLIVHYHMEPAADGPKGTIFRLYRLFVTPLLIRAADIVTCASLDYVSHSDLKKYYRKNERKFREVAFGVDAGRFKVKDLKSKNLDKNSKNILFVGGLDKAHYFKGVEVLLKAVGKLEIENWKLEIVGDGDLRPQYERMARELGIADKVDFAGRVADRDLPGYYQQCDVFVLPSINQGEAFGMVLLEAMAAGKPVVASCLPGVRSVFENGKQGLLAKPGDAADLAEKISAILNDEVLAKKMGEEGRKSVEEKYSWEKAGEKLDEIYKVCAMSRKRR